MLVYRIEHREQQLGPFNAERCDMDIAQRRRMAKFNYEFHRMMEGSHPMPDDDAIKLVTYDSMTWVFACPTLETIFHWFEKFLDIFKYCDFVLRTFEISDESQYKTGKSGTQVAFNRYRATMVEEWEL